MKLNPDGDGVSRAVRDELLALLGEDAPVQDQLRILDERPIRREPRRAVSRATRRRIRRRAGASSA